jgi:anaerobic ribonucleoside-triphosphate reductase
MLVQHSYDSRFVDMLERLKKEVGEKMFESSGIGASQLDMNSFSKNFFTEDGNTADKSIDANANVNEKSVTGWMTESTKSIMKLNAYYQLWNSALKKHGIKRANKMIESEIKGAIRVHDLWLWNKPYCWAASLNCLVEQGMPFHQQPKTGKIKHFDSFINVSLQYLCFLSNSIAGAVALSDFFAYAEYFIRKDFGEAWFEHPESVTRIKQLFQNWIFSINFSWRSNQSPFTNLSIMDTKWIDALFSSHFNPDYTSVNVENLMRTQKLFVECVIENKKNNPFTFPVLTACLLYDKGTENFSDPEFASWVADINSKTGIFNIFSDDNINALSSCCFKGDEVIRVLNKNTNLSELMSISTFVSQFNIDATVNGKVDTQYQICAYDVKEKTAINTDIIGILRRKNEFPNLIEFSVDGRKISVTPDHVLFVRHKDGLKELELPAKIVAESPEMYELAIE